MNGGLKARVWATSVTLVLALMATVSGLVAVDGEPVWLYYLNLGAWIAVIVAVCTMCAIGWRRESRLGGALEKLARLLER
jgi:hypothetical protein